MKRYLFYRKRDKSIIYQFDSDTNPKFVIDNVDGEIYKHNADNVYEIDEMFVPSIQEKQKLVEVDLDFKRMLRYEANIEIELVGDVS